MKKVSPPRLDPTNRDPIPERDLKDVFRQLISAPPSKLKSKNREPTRKELAERYRLVRRG